MAITINGTAGTLAGIVVGGLPDGIVDDGTLATDSVTSTKIADGTIVNADVNDVAASKLTGALPAISGASLTGIAVNGGLKSQQVFTSSGTWTKPSGVNLIKVYITGAGGGSNSTGGGGGAGGGTAIEIIDVSSVSSVSITIGTGGADSNPGNTGGTSSFGSYCSATGGAGGTANSGGGSYPGAGGVGSGGSINLTGGGATTMQTHAGGETFWGGSGKGSRQDETYSHGGDGTYGGGGGGGYGNNYSGNGGNGACVVEEYS